MTAGPGAGVGIVFVSHSARIAEGLVELAGQMAPDVRLVAAGGTDDDGIGTSASRIEAGIREAAGGRGVLVIGDLGSAILTAETVADLLEDPPAGGVQVLDAPLVEGGVAAAVAAQAGDDLAAVAAAAAGEPRASDAPRTEDHRDDDPVDAARPEDVDRRSASVVLADPEGLHARPAAELVRTASGFTARVTVDGVDARSLLAVLARGLRHGSRVEVRAEGPDAAAAVDAVVTLLGRDGRS